MILRAKDKPTPPPDDEQDEEVITVSMSATQPMMVRASAILEGGGDEQIPVIVSVTRTRKRKYRAMPLTFSPLGVRGTLTLRGNVRTGEVVRSSYTFDAPLRVGVGGRLAVRGDL